MEKYGDPGRDDLQSYVRRYDELEIGGVVAEQIEYLFWRGKFYAATVMIRSADWNVFKKAVFERYGAVKKNEESEESYSWHGKQTDISLTYKYKRDASEREGRLFISSNDIFKEMLMYYSRNRTKGF